MLKVYLLSVLVMLALILPAFLQDNSPNSRSLLSWMTLIIALVIAPVALPGVVFHKIKRLIQASKTETAELTHTLSKSKL